jgi:hypothetical protein
VDELARKRQASSEQLSQGVFLYERGRYSESVFEEAMEEAGEATPLGGECALWLALAYDAAGQRNDCIELYKRLEATHSVKEIRKQASDLRYILEAPKLEIGADERVSIPLVDDTNYRDQWAVRGKAAKPPRKFKKDAVDEWLEKYEPPGALTNRFALAATSVIAFGLALYSASYIRVPHVPH